MSSRVTDCPAVQRLADGPDGKQPYVISAADGEVLSFAGLWDRWKNPETGEPVTSCTIIVTDANALTRPIHDRMPGGARSGGCQAVAERRRRHRASQAGQSFLSRWVAQHRVCLHIRGRDGKPIAETTLKKHFAHELMVGKVEVVTKVLTKFMQAIDEGKQWAIERYMDQRMWRPESGGWRARPYEVSLGGASSAASGGSDLRPLQLIVQFVAPDPSMRPILP